MTLVSRLFGLQNRSDAGGASLQKWSVWLDGYGSPTSSGKYVGHDSMLSISAAYAAVRLIAETIGSLPLTLRQRMPDGSKKDATGDPTFDVFKEPNDDDTQMHFMQTLCGHAAVRGNAYAEIKRDGKGRVKELRPIHPDRVMVKRQNGKLLYQVMPDQVFDNSKDYVVVNGGEPTRWLTPDQVLHFRLFSVNGTTGLSPVQFFKDTLGEALAQQEYSSRLFSNGAMPRGILSVDDDALTDEERSSITEAWKQAHQGSWNAHKTAVLPSSVKWQGLSFTAEDAQFLQSRNFSVTEIARIFHVPPHMLGQLERSTNNNIQQQSLEFLIYTIRPWLQAWEQFYNKQVLTVVQREKGLFLEFDVDALLRTDVQTETNVDQTKINNGTLSVNEVRLKNGLSPVEGGDEHFIGLNMGKIGNQQPLTNINEPSTAPDPQAADDPQSQDGTLSPPPKSPNSQSQSQSNPPPKPQSPQNDGQKPPQNDPKTAKKRAENAFMVLIASEIAQVQRKEALIISKQAKKLRGEAFESWLPEFCAEIAAELRGRLEEKLLITASGLIDVDDETADKVRERAQRVAETYGDGIKATIAAISERSAQNGSVQWAAFMQSLESSELEQERGMLARQMATNELNAILALKGDHDNVAA